MKWLKNLFRHRHKWRTTHTNPWQHPTRQICKCGLSREIKTTSFGVCKWAQSDGVESEEFEWGKQ